MVDPAFKDAYEKAMRKTVPLEDGKYGYVFTELQGRNHLKRFKCHVCSKIIFSVKPLIQHAVHPVHKNNLAILSHPRSQFSRFTNIKPTDESDVEEKEEIEQAVLPGEPVPPGLEGIVDSVCQIQATFDNFTAGPLIGLEYIVELVSTSEKVEPRYICLLCEKKGDPRSVMVHVTSYNHYLKYICCFFRTVGNKMNLMPKDKIKKKAFNIAIVKIAEAIETNYGRLKPVSADMDSFSQKKYEILREIDEKEHFRETPATTFLELVTADKMKKYAQEVLPVPEPVPEKLVEKPPSSRSTASQIKPSGEAVKPADAVPVVEKTKLPEVQAAPLGDEAATKKLRIALSKPERSIPGVTMAPIQNQPGIQNSLKSKTEEDDDVIILPDSSNEPIEVESLSSISEGSMNSKHSRSRSKSSSRRGRRARSRRRSPSYDRFGRRRLRSRERYSRKRDDDRRREDDRRRDDARRRYDDRRRDDYRRDEYRKRDDSRSREELRRDEDRRKEDGDIRPDDDWRARRAARPEEDRSRDLRLDLDRDRVRDGRPVRRSRSRSYERARPWRSRSRSPLRNYESNERSKLILDERSRKHKWDIYRADLDFLEKDMSNLYKYYQARPEKHPNYPEEWKMFWNRRYKEIQLSGQDPTNYDFKPEWIQFWEKRMKELHEKECLTKRENLKRSHNLDELKEIRMSHDLQDISPPTPEGSRDVTVSDIKKTWKALTGSDITGPKRSPSPWEKDHHGDKSHPQTTDKEPVRLVFQPVPPIVHCLRMLSVLENQLGFQASRVMELLSQALAMEKISPSGSMQLLQNKDIYILFETLKEKMRGQLMAGIVMRQMVATTRNVIKGIESMLAANPLKPEVFEPVTIPGVGAVDKVAVAQKIASALIKMGKVNLNQTELEQLINAVVGMANASSISSDISSDSFFSQLNIKNSNASNHINNIINSMISNAKQVVSTEPTQSTAKDLPDSMKRIQQYTADSPLVEKDDDVVMVSNPPESTRGPSPFSLRSGGTNPVRSPDAAKKLQKTVETINDDDDDDDDYSFEDVFHAASEKLKLNEKKVDSVDENSQTQSSLASGSLSSNMKAVTDIFGPLNNIQPEVVNILSSLSSTMKESKPEPIVKNDHSIPLLQENFNQQFTQENRVDNSLVTSIKNSLVEGFTEASSTAERKEWQEERKPERVVLDPRARADWDESLKSLNNPNDRTNWDPSWKADQWGQRYDGQKWAGDQWQEGGRGEQGRWEVGRGPSDWGREDYPRDNYRPQEGNWKHWERTSTDPHWEQPRAQWPSSKNLMNTLPPRNEPPRSQDWPQLDNRQFPQPRPQQRFPFDRSFRNF